MTATCFLTGVTGFVGANLGPMLAQRYQLRCLVRPGQRIEALAGIDHERVEGDLESEAALSEGVRDTDLVVHLGALVSFRREDRERMFAVNAEATARLATLARQAGVGRMLHVSTISAVAYSNRPEVLDETAGYNWRRLHIGYSDSKHAAEQAVLGEVRKGLDAIIVNPPSMYGAGDRRKSEGSLMDALMRGRIRFAPPGGLNVANVLDVCHGMLQAVDLGRTGERYILGGENLTGRQLFQRIATIVGGRAPDRCPPRLPLLAAAWILRQKERLLGSRPPLTSEILSTAPRWLWYSSNKAAEQLGYEPGPVDAGIEASWQWMRRPDNVIAGNPA